MAGNQERRKEEGCETALETKIQEILGLMPELRGAKVVVRPLEGGLTNRNYLLQSGRDRFVLRLAGENSEMLGIDRRVEHLCAQAAFRAGIGPEVAAFFPERGAMVSRFVPGRVLDEETLRSPPVLRGVAASLRRWHECPGGAGTFSAFATVRGYYARSRELRVQFPGQIEAALAALDRIEREAGVPDRLCPCHNDLLPGNFVRHRRAIWILDWEYAGIGDLFFDLGNLAANNLFGPEQESKLLRHYFGRARPDDLRRLRLMRRVSDLREAMWGFLQTGVSQLDFDYRDYAHRHLRRFLEQERGEA